MPEPRAWAIIRADAMPQPSASATLPAPSDAPTHRAARAPRRGARRWALLGVRRVVKAHLVTLIVLGSYLWLGFSRRWRSEAVLRRRTEAAHARNARRIYRAIVELQGLYIKVGQLFSIMTNVLPRAFRAELAALQDKVPARPFDAIEQRVRDEFEGRGPAELFESFDRTPIASASIGQVHAARLRGGQRVAVKVQYPDIEQIVRADLATLRRIFHLVQRFIRYPGLDAIYSEIRALILQELDFTAEARHAEQIGAIFANSSEVRFPRVVRELTTRRVLTTDFVEGVKVNDLAGLRQLGVDPRALARPLIEAYCRQIFDYGIYHADPHPGNILVSAGPVITFVDFGAVGVLSEKMRHGIVQLLQAAVHRDTPRIIAALHEMGFIAHDADPRIYDRVVEYLHARFQREIHLDSFNLKDIRFDPQRGLQNLADLRQMNISLGDITDTFHVPKEWIVLERTVLLLTGLCTELDPELNPMTVISPHLERFVLGKDGDWSRFMLDAGRDAALAAVALPAELRKFMSRALQGELQVQLVGRDEAAPLYVLLVHELIYTALGLAGGFGALRLHERGERAWALGLGIAAGVCGLLLLRAMSGAQRLLRRRR